MICICCAAEFKRVRNGRYRVCPSCSDSAAAEMLWICVCSHHEGPRAIPPERFQVWGGRRQSYCSRCTNINANLCRGYRARPRLKIVPSPQEQEYGNEELRRHSLAIQLLAGRQMWG